MNIGLTGGIATGKSTVSNMLVERGAILIDADQLAREVVLPGSPLLAKVVDKFGQAVLMADGALNRKALGQLVFNDEEARRDLEAILHPPIRELMLSRMQQYEAEHPERLVVADVPLLFESRLEKYFSCVMLVYAPEAVQLRRLMERNQLSEAEAQARLKAQMPIEDKRKLTPIIIDNSGTIEETSIQIDRFWEEHGLA